MTSRLKVKYLEEDDEEVFGLQGEMNCSDTAQQVTTVDTKLETKNGFSYITLDEESSELTTFHTSFGRYCLAQITVWTMLGT